jgi:hypothetical protein
MLTAVLLLMAMACLAAGTAFALWYISRGDDDGEADGGGGGGELPPPSREDGQCVTSMGNGNDSGDCFALLYNHCTPGYMSQAGIPDKLQQSKKSIIKQMHQVVKQILLYNTELELLVILLQLVVQLIQLIMVGWLELKLLQLSLTLHCHQLVMVNQ